MKKKHSICIIGGSGYIGSSLAEGLLKEGYEIKIFDLRPPKSNKLKSMTTFMKGDIRSFSQVKEAIKDCDIVIHTAIIQIPLVNYYKREGFEVNVQGTINVCKAIEEYESIKGMILTSTWHVYGEYCLMEVIDEKYAYRPDYTEERARFYALSKSAQEIIVRLFSEFSQKYYVIFRLGTVLGEGMSPRTVASIFIDKGIRGDPLTPFKHSMYRPMFYVDIRDIVKIVKKAVVKILTRKLPKGKSSLDTIYNVLYPEPITIIELAKIIKKVIYEETNGKINPLIEIVDKGSEDLIHSADKKQIFKINIKKTESTFNIKFSNPRETLKRLIRKKLKLQYYDY